MSVRVVIADDSAVARRFLRQALVLSGAIVCAECEDGPSALRAVQQHKPHMLLLDVEMPGNDQLETLRSVRRNRPETSVVMCSAATRRGAAVTLMALSLGATDYITKPECASPAEAVRVLAKQLAPGVASIQLSTPSARRFLPPAQCDAAGRRVYQAQTQNEPRLVVIGSSTGGPSALELLFGALPRNFPLPVVVVQHMPALFSGALAARLANARRMPVIEARDRTPLQPGLAVIARGGRDVMVQHAGNGIELIECEELAPGGCTPSIDRALASAVQVERGGVVACILTGMGDDGLTGCGLVRENGGAVLAQTQESSVVWGMSRAVTEAGLATYAGPPAALARQLERIARRTQQATDRMQPRDGDR